MVYVKSGQIKIDDLPISVQIIGATMPRIALPKCKVVQTGELHYLKQLSDNYLPAS